MKYGFIVFIFVVLHGNVGAQDTIDNRIDTDRYPKHTELYKMRLISDSIVKSVYGEKFFNSQIRWSYKDSYYFLAKSADSNFPNGWPYNDIDTINDANAFSVRYDIVYNSGVMKSGIQILMDRAGNLLPFHRCNNKGAKIYNQGFEKIDTNDSDFKLTTEEALQLAVNNGLKTKDTSRVSCKLAWYPAMDSTAVIDSGNFYFEVLYTPEFTKGERKKFQKGNKVEYDSYIWLYDPWTKELIRRSTIPRYFKTSRRY